MFALLGAVFGTVLHIEYNHARAVRELSKMMSVSAKVAPALSAYYELHGEYPGSLRELPLQTIQWGDEGSSVRDLESWTYNSDGQSYIMRWQGARGKKLFLGGRKGQNYYSEDEKR